MAWYWYYETLVFTGDYLYIVDRLSSDVFNRKFYEINGSVHDVLTYIVVNACKCVHKIDIDFG